MNIRFCCPVCERAGIAHVPGQTSWKCPGCDHLLRLPEEPPSQPLSHCQICGNPEVYRKKDFPHWLGLSLLTAACLASVIPHWLYMPWLTWTILIGTAIFDGLLYLIVGDVVVCYRCQAQHRGLEVTDSYKPFDLGIGERYRQERLRREGLQAARKGS